MRTLHAALAAAPLVVIAVGTRADERPRVAVTFHLDEPTYKAAFPTPADLEAFEASAAAKIEEALEPLGFLEFDADAEADPDIHRLDVTLYRQDPANDDVERYETFFRLELNGKEVDPHWKFREWEDYDLGVSASSFHLEIGETFGRRLADQWDDFIVKRMSEISLADRVCVGKVGESTFCVLPFSFDELEAEHDTIFFFETEPDLFPRFHWAIASPTPASRVPNLDPEFATGILARETTSQLEIEKPHTPMPAPDEPIAITVKGIFIFHYVHRPKAEVDEASPLALIEEESP